MTVQNYPKWVNCYVGGPEIPEEVQCPKCWTMFVDTTKRCFTCQDTEIHPCPFSEVWGYDHVQRS